jgi:nitrogen fixation/metabolism regulation signal transduction histidine kinase
MTFDNSKTIINLRIKLFGATVIILAFIVLTYIAKMIKYPLLGMSETAWTLILVGLYILYAMLPLIMNYQYIYFSDDGENIIFRYFTAGIVGGRKNSIEIDKRAFSGFKSETKFFGMIMSITLFQRFQEGVAKYPSVYISALSRDERSRLLKSLSRHTVKE